MFRSSYHQESNMWIGFSNKIDLKLLKISSSFWQTENRSMWWPPAMMKTVVRQNKPAYISQGKYPSWEKMPSVKAKKEYFTESWLKFLQKRHTFHLLIKENGYCCAMWKGGISSLLFWFITTAFDSRLQFFLVFVWLYDSLRAYTEPGNSDTSFCFPDTVSGMWACLYRSGAVGHAWNAHQMTLGSVTNMNSCGKHLNGRLIVMLEITIWNIASFWHFEQYITFSK